MQTDQVIELDVVTGDGRELKCSAGKPTRTCSMPSAAGSPNAASSRAPRCGWCARRSGCAAISCSTAIWRRWLRISAACSRTDRFDQLQGAIIPDGKGGWRYQLEAADSLQRRGSRQPDHSCRPLGQSRCRRHHRPELARRRAGVRKSSKRCCGRKAFGPIRSPGCSLSSAAAMRSARGRVMQGLTSDDLGAFGRITFYPMQTRAFRSPLVRMPEGRHPRSRSTSSASRGRPVRRRSSEMVAQNRALYDRIREAGGVLYPVSAFAMSAEDWKQYFGPRWPQLAWRRSGATIRTIC